MNRHEIKRTRHVRRKAGVRKNLLGVPSRPRLSVYRSLSHIYAQVIDDLKGHTLAAASSRDEGVAGSKKDAATQVGKLLAERARNTLTDVEKLTQALAQESLALPLELGGGGEGGDAPRR